MRFLKSILFLYCILGINAAVNAAKLPEFEALFDVKAFGLTLGQAQQKLTCKKEACELSSYAKPTGFAANFFQDTSLEIITLQQQNSQLIWRSHYKKETLYKDNTKEVKERKVYVNAENSKILHSQNTQQWPIKKQVYDSISMAYAIQHALINNAPLDQFTLQTFKYQEPLRLQSDQQYETLALSFAKDVTEAVKYRFESTKAKISIWLLPNEQYFPAVIQVTKDDNKTVTLTLAERPAIYETQ